MQKKWMLIVVSLTLVTFSSCKKALEESVTSSQLDAANMAQTVGDLMASVDEAGGSTGSLAMMKSEINMIARIAPNAVDKPSLFSLFAPSAQATDCSAVGFSGCVNNVITRTFSDCTIGTATMSGTVSLVYYDNATDNTCSLSTSGYQVHRRPNFEITTSQGAKLAVTKTGTWGQNITKTNAGGGQLYILGNDGINRKLTFNGVTLMDVTTTILDSDKLIVSGTSRTGRTINAGTIVIANNLNGKTCTMQPSNLTWNGSCNCPVSGSWTGSCDDSGTTATLDITGCGTANATLDGETKSVDFDRCY